MPEGEILAVTIYSCATFLVDTSDQFQLGLRGGVAQLQSSLQSSGPLNPEPKLLVWPDVPKREEVVCAGGPIAQSCQNLRYDLQRVI